MRRAIKALAVAAAGRATLRWIFGVRSDAATCTCRPRIRKRVSSTKGFRQTAKLCYSGNVLMENRNGLVVDVLLAPADGRAEREAAVRMLQRQPSRRRRTVAADKGYQAAAFITSCRAMKITPQVARNITAYRGSNIDDRSAARAAYVIGQRVRKRVEEIFGWVKAGRGPPAPVHRR